MVGKFLGATLLLVPLAGGLAGCGSRDSPEAIADAFAHAYFEEMDQEKAKEYTALGATSMLDAELKEVLPLRKEGYTPGQAQADVRIHRGETTARDQRVRVPYEVVIRSDGGETVRDADVELAKIGGSWKVVRVGLVSRAAQ